MNTTIDHTLNAAGITVQAIREFVQEWATITTPARVEVVSAADDARLIQEALDAGELLPSGKGRYYARSHVNDTARSEARTVVATSNPSDRGVYNNWHPANEITATLRERMRAASAGKTMYVVPYLMAVPGTPLAPFAAGVQLTDDRTVVLHMIRMARVGLHLFDDLDDPDFFVRGVHVTGDLDTLNQGTPEDQRLFATIADQRTILHYGSAYGGNALLGKIAHALRLASYDGWVSGRFLAEQFLLLGIVDTHTGRTYHVCGGFPSASGKTNLAMTLPPDTLGDRYRVEFYGDDIAWLWAGDDGRLYGMNPENGIFGVAKDTNETTNPAAVDAMGPGSGAIFTNVARHDLTGEVWWEGKTPEPPTQIEGWRDWAGHLITDRDERTRNDPWAHPNSRFATALTNIPTLAPAADHPAGVPIDAIIFGGRTSDREPLIRAITDLAEGVYDGLTLGAEATFAAEGLDGQLRYDPMSMRPFLSYPEGTMPSTGSPSSATLPTHRSSLTSIGSSEIQTMAATSGPGTVKTSVLSFGLSTTITDARTGSTPRSALSPQLTNSTSTDSTSKRAISTGCFISTVRDGVLRWATVASISPNCRTSPNLFVTYTNASPRNLRSSKFSHLENRVGAT